MISLGEVREHALGLAGVTELAHWGIPSFRVRDRIFATVPDAEHLNVMIDPFDVEAVVRDEPAACTELWWGGRLRGVQVVLPAATPELVRRLLEVAWRRKAPRPRSAKA